MAAQPLRHVTEGRRVDPHAERTVEAERLARTFLYRLAHRALGGGEAVFVRRFQRRLEPFGSHDLSVRNKDATGERRKSAPPVTSLRAPLRRHVSRALPSIKPLAAWPDVLLVLHAAILNKNWSRDGAHPG